MMSNKKGRRHNRRTVCLDNTLLGIRTSKEDLPFCGVLSAYFPVTYLLLGSSLKRAVSLRPPLRQRWTKMHPAVVREQATTGCYCDCPCSCFTSSVAH